MKKRWKSCREHLPEIADKCVVKVDGVDWFPVIYLGTHGDDNAPSFRWEDVETHQAYILQSWDLEWVPFPEKKERSDELRLLQ